MVALHFELRKWQLQKLYNDFHFVSLPLDLRRRGWSGGGAPTAEFRQEEKEAGMKDKNSREKGNTPNAALLVAMTQQK